jgi:hypothetical protein
MGNSEGDLIGRSVHMCRSGDSQPVHVCRLEVISQNMHDKCDASASCLHIADASRVHRRS